MLDACCLLLDACLQPSSMDQSSRPTSASSHRTTALDRTVQVFLDSPNNDDTPSKRDGISASVERLHRLHGTSLLLTAWKLLFNTTINNASCYITSCTILHLYLRRVSLRTTNVWSVAMASTLLSAKLHDCSGSVVSLSTIVHVYAHLYRRRILRVGLPNEGGDGRDRHNDGSTTHPYVASLPIPVPTSETVIATSSVASHQGLAPQPMSPMGPVYQEWTQTILETEHQILRALGFTLYWIPDRHAHKYLPYFLRVLQYSNIGQTNKDTVAQRAWNYCNDSYRLDVCTRYPSHVVACAAIHLSILDCGGGPDKSDDGALESEKSGPCEQFPWWEHLIGKHRSTEVALVANALLGLCHSTETHVATFCFLPSIHGQAFNDPNSFVWSQVEQQQQQLQATAAGSGN